MDFSPAAFRSKGEVIGTQHGLETGVLRMSDQTNKFPGLELLM